MSELENTSTINLPLSGMERLRVMSFYIFILISIIIGATMFAITGRHLIAAAYIVPLPILVFSGIYIMKVDKDFSPVVITRKWVKRYIQLFFVSMFSVLVINGGGFFHPIHVFSVLDRHPHHKILLTNDMRSSAYLHSRSIFGKSVRITYFPWPDDDAISEEKINKYFDLIDAKKGELNVSFYDNWPSQGLCRLRIRYKDLTGKSVNYEEIFDRVFNPNEEFEGYQCSRHSDKSYKNMFSSREKFMHELNAFNEIVENFILEIDEASHNMKINRILTVATAIPMIFVFTYIFMFIYDMLFFRIIKSHKNWVVQNGIFENKQL